MARAKKTNWFFIAVVAIIVVIAFVLYQRGEIGAGRAFRYPTLTYYPTTYEAPTTDYVAPTYTTTTYTAPTTTTYVAPTTTTTTVTNAQILSELRLIETAIFGTQGRLNAKLDAFFEQSAIPMVGGKEPGCSCLYTGGLGGSNYNAYSICGSCTSSTCAVSCSAASSARGVTHQGGTCYAELC